MAFKARDGLPKVQLDRMTKSQLVATVKKLQKRETALLNQVARLQLDLDLYRARPVVAATALNEHDAFDADYIEQEPADQAPIGYHAYPWEKT